MSPQSTPTIPLIQSTDIPIVDQEDTQVDKIGGKGSESIVEYLEEVYEMNQDVTDQHIEEEEIVLEEQPGCEEGSPTIPEAPPEISLERKNMEENTLDIAESLPKELIEPVKDVESSPTIQEQHENFEDLFLSSPYLQEESHLVIPIENLFPEINDSSSHRMTLPAPDHPFTIQGWFLNSKSMSVNFETIPDTNSYFLPLPESAYTSKATRGQFVEVAKLHQAPETIKFATYFRRTLWHLLGAHITFSAAHHPATRGQT